MVSVHWNARPVSRKIIKAMLHSSTVPEMGVGLAIGLATTADEEVLVTVVTGVVVVVLVRRTRRRESMSSWKGSGALILPTVWSDLLLWKETQTEG